MKLVDAKNAFRGVYRGSETSVWQALTRVRDSLGTENYKELVRWLDAGSRPYRRVVLKVSPSSFSDLRYFTLGATNDIRRELLWAAAVLGRSREELRRHLATVKSLTKPLMRSEYESARLILESIQESGEFSIWLLELTIAVTQLAKGLNAQKDFVKSAMPEKMPGATGYIAFKISERNEDATNIERFVERITYLVSAAKTTDSIRDYVLFKLLKQLPSEKGRLAEILRRDACISAVDLYESFIAVSKKLLHDGSDPKIVKVIIQSLEELAGVGDVRIDNLLAIYARKPSVRPKVSRKYLILENLLAVSRLTEASKRMPVIDAESSVKWCDLIARCVASGMPTNAMGELLNLWPIGLLSRVYSRKEGWHEALLDVRKRALNLKAIDEIATLTAIIDPQTLEGARATKTHNLDFLTSSEELLPAHAKSFGMDVDQFRAEWATGFETREYISCIETELYGTPATGNAAIDLAAIAGASNALDRLDYKSAITRLREPRRFSSPVLQARARLLFVQAQLKLGLVQDALVFIAETCAEQEDLRHEFSLRLLAQGKTWGELRHLSGSVSLAVVLDLYLREREDDRQRTNLRYAFDEALIKNKIARPSDLADCIGSFGKRQVVYFLRRIAVQHVMDVSLKFRGSRQLDEERQNVLSRLVELDPKNKGLYEAELLDLTTKLRVQEGLRRIDQTRVFVDTAAYLRWSIRDLGDAFQRYRALSNAGIGTTGATYSAALLDFLQHQAPVPPELFEVPKAEGDEILVDVVRRLASAFFGDPEFGLEFFLSTRVRHGSLAGHMRGPLEVQNLITTRDESGRYKNNDALASLLPQITEPQKVHLNAACAKFSEQFDSMLQTLTQEYLQIRSSAKPQGALALTISALEFHRFKEIAQRKDSTIENFVRECADAFWLMVAKPLEEIRTHIQSDIKVQSLMLLGDLETALQKCLTWPQQMVAAIHINNARTEIQSAIDRIAEWFLPREEVRSEHYTAEQVVDIGLEFTKKACRGFEPVVTRNIEARSIVFGTSALAKITDCLFIMLENVHKYSKLDNPKVQIGLAFNRAAKVLQIGVGSEVAEGVRAANEARLAQIRADIASPSFAERVKGEGGRGLMKLRGMASPGISAPLTFGFVDDRHFTVDVAIPSLTVALAEEPATTKA